MPNIPLYKVVYQKLKSGIKTSQYPIGSFLPTENELCKEFQASKTTIRKAVGMLGSEGYLSIRQGRGTEVLDTSTTQELSHITSITETLTSRGYRVSVCGMSIQKILAPDIVAEKLQLHDNMEVFKVERLLYADDHPIAYVINYLRASMFKDLDHFVNTFTGLYSFLERQYSIVPMNAIETLSAEVADFTVSQLLHIQQGAPLLCSSRVSSVDGVPFEYGISKLVADRYEYSIYLKGRR